MEPHPVPKNILTVEFKLFGALTVKQFSKVLIGSLVALGIFILQLPGIIGVPFMIISVLMGIFGALVKDFEVKVLNVVKSLVVSPRYVWEKMEKTPDALRREQMKKKGSSTAKKISKQTTTDVHDITLDRLLDARAAQQLEPEPSASSDDDNFARVYGDIYQEEVNKVNQASPQQTITPQIQPQPALVQPQPPANERIIELQTTLNEMTKQNASAEQKQPIIDEIDSIYSRLRQTAQGQLPPEQVQPLDKKRMFYGITVDVSEAPVSGAQITLKLGDGTVVGQAISADDGRFALESQLPQGEYIVQIQHQSKNFPEFKLALGEGNLPAYKFREG